MARDDFDDRPVPTGGKGPLDGFFGGNMALIVLFGLCCGTIALIVGLIGLFTAKDPVAKQRATIVVVIQVIFHIVGIGLNVAGLTAGFGGAGAGGGAR